MEKLTASQAELLAYCLDKGAAWCTSRRDNPNLTMLRGWRDRKWMKEVDAPVPTLISFEITGYGREPLKKILEDFDE